MSIVLILLLFIWLGGPAYSSAHSEFVLLYLYGSEDRPTVVLTVSLDVINEMRIRQSLDIIIPDWSIRV